MYLGRSERLLEVRVARPPAPAVELDDGVEEIVGGRSQAGERVSVEGLDGRAPHRMALQRTRTKIEPLSQGRLPLQQQSSRLG